MYNRRYYESLLRRVAILEQLYLEGAKDDLKKYLGAELYNDYMKIRDKISDTDWKDFGIIQKKKLSDIRDYVDNFQSKSDIKRQEKDGAKLIYNKDGWMVYRIIKYNAAKHYGKNTKWCISGNYKGDEERGEHYFNTYIETRKLDGGYYFYIAPDGKKYCVLKRKDGTIDTIWLPNDYRVQSSKILSIRPDFPSVPGVFDFNNFNKVTDKEKEDLLVRAANKCKADLKDRLNSYYDKCSFSKPSISDDTVSFNFNVTLFFSNARVKGTIKLTYKSPVAFDFNYSFIDTKKLLNDGKGVSGTINDVAVFENSAEGEDEILYEDFYNALTDADNNLESA